MKPQSIPKVNKTAIICDIDGTLAIRGDRGPYEHERASEDTLNAPVKNLLNIYKKEGYDIWKIL